MRACRLLPWPVAETTGAVPVVAADRLHIFSRTDAAAPASAARVSGVS